MNRRAKQKLKARSKKKGKKPIGKGNFIYKFKKTKQQRKKNKIKKESSRRSGIEPRASRLARFLLYHCFTEDHDISTSKSI